MKSKPFLIAVAAFALTASGVQAFGNTQMLERAGLSQAQISAFEVAREKRDAGDLEGARDVLVEAGVDEKVLRSVNKIAHENRAAMHKALTDLDYEAFKTAVEGTPLAQTIDSEAEFKQFVEAHALKEVGKWSEAKVILDELGVEQPHQRGIKGHHAKGMKLGHLFQDLTDDQKEALRVAHQANDKEAVQAILKEAGIEMPMKAHR